MIPRFSKKDTSLLIGNALDHYDSAIYGFLAPLLAPLFFPNFDPVVQLILAYSLLGTSLVTRPLGTLIFGSVARKYGPQTGLSYSLIGVAVSMVVMGCLPTYDQGGWVAPLSLACGRLIKGIFSAGESTIAKLYIMEHKDRFQALKASYYYQSSSVLGAIFASGLVTFILDWPPYGWRVCFWVGGSAAAIGYLLRCYGSPLPLLNPTSSSLFPDFQAIWAHKMAILRVTLATGFGHVTGTVPFIFMNTFVPLISDISFETMMGVNTLLLALDMILIPLIGHGTRGVQPQTLMITASLMLTLTLVPLFFFLPQASLTYVIGVRIWIVFWGIVFMCPMNFWFKSLFPAQDQYLFIGMGGALGASLLGRLLTPFGLWLWYGTEMTYVPALYFTFITALTAYSLVYKVKVQTTGA